MKAYASFFFPKVPDAASLGASPCTLLTEYLLCNTADRGWDETYAIAQAQAAAKAGQPLFLDIESRPLDIRYSSRSKVWAGAAEIAYLLDLIQAAVGGAGIPVGLVVPPPIVAMRPLDTDAAGMKAIQAASDFISQLLLPRVQFLGTQAYFNVGEDLSAALPRLDMFLDECDRLDPTHTRKRACVVWDRRNSPAGQPKPVITDTNMFWEFLRAIKQRGRTDAMIGYDDVGYDPAGGAVDAPPCFATLVNFWKTELT